MSLYGFPTKFLTPTSCQWENLIESESQMPRWNNRECDNLTTNLLSVPFQHAWVWLLWLLSQTWITLHIWTPKCERLATTEKLFVRPMYDALLIDQSMSLNRRCDDEKDVKTEVSFGLDGRERPGEYAGIWSWSGIRVCFTWSGCWPYAQPSSFSIRA